MRSKGSRVEKNGMTWVDPSLLVEVSYFEKAEGGHFRFRSSSGSWGKFDKEIKSCLNISDKI